ncbi:M48 family metallopeptidase [Paracoccus sp. DMF]|nr:M48 family metallopeptidase [Paracoccus sp. DMF]MCV2446748.1 M48 family metallopeptidase [Paracoccus sp. DMF]
MLTLIVQDQPHRAVTHFRRKLVRCLAHDAPPYSGVGASGKPGAVHTCNIEARRVWLNLELIKKPPQCLEYVIVHELAHFFERNHTEQFVALLDRMLPHWRIVRDELNAEALAHEDWST